jgi:hypothetical protein
VRISAGEIVGIAGWLVTGSVVALIVCRVLGLI